ncbi:MAG: hypothetical protein V1647_05720 [Pseudomonadota bacterium]
MKNLLIIVVLAMVGALIPSSGHASFLQDLNQTKLECPAAVYTALAIGAEGENMTDRISSFYSGVRELGKGK